MSKKKISGIIFGFLIVGVIAALITPWILNGAINFQQSLDKPECPNNNCIPQNDQNINQLTGKPISENTKNYFNGGISNPNSLMVTAKWADEIHKSGRYHMAKNNCEKLEKMLDAALDFQRSRNNVANDVKVQIDRGVTDIAQLEEQCWINRGEMEK